MAISDIDMDQMKRVAVYFEFTRKEANPRAKYRSKREERRFINDTAAYFGTMRGRALWNDAIKDQTEDASTLDGFSLEIFEDLAFVMWSAAHPEEKYDSPDEWLDQFNTFSIYQICFLQALYVENCRAKM